MSAHYSGKIAPLRSRLGEWRSASFRAATVRKRVLPRNVSLYTILLLTFAVARLPASPVGFAKTELRRVLAERGLPADAPRFQTRLVPGKPECYRITSEGITGSDERGLMYGVLEVAEQIRASGRISNTSACPEIALRGTRYFLHNHDL